MDSHRGIQVENDDEPMSWFFTRDGLLVSSIAEEDCVGAAAVARRLLLQAPSKPSIRRRLKRGGLSRLEDYVGYALATFEAQSTDEAPRREWLDLLRESEKVSADPAIGAALDAVIGDDSQRLRATLQRALRDDLLGGLLGVHVVLSANGGQLENAVLFRRLQLAVDRGASANATFVPYPVRWFELLREEDSRAALDAIRRMLAEMDDEDQVALEPLLHQTVIQRLATADVDTRGAVLDVVREIVEICDSSWSLQQMLARAEFEEGELLASLPDAVGASWCYARAAAMVPEHVEPRNKLNEALENVDRETSESIQIWLVSDEAFALAERRKLARERSLVRILGFASDADGSRAATRWVKQFVEEGTAPTSLPGPLVGCEKPLEVAASVGESALEDCILANARVPELRIPFGTEALKFATVWREHLAKRLLPRRPLQPWSANRWLTSTRDLGFKVLAAAGVVGLVVGTVMTLQREGNLKARDGAFQRSAASWAAGDAAGTRDAAREFLELLPEGSTDNRASAVAQRLQLATLRGIATLKNVELLRRAQRDLTLASAWGPDESGTESVGPELQSNVAEEVAIESKEE